jgi:nitronate monooxygenase
MARRLQNGDPGGHIRQAMDEFPFPEMTQRILQRYFIPGGKPEEAVFAATTVLPMQPTHEQTALVVVANFVEVHLAKLGHEGPIGINYLEKIQTPTLASLYGAMLADVDYVLMGAGIPKSIPGILDHLADGEDVQMPLTVAGTLPDEGFSISFSPASFTKGEVPWLKRPKFLAIVASATLATMLAKKAEGHVDGFVIEGPTAGGHNAPPRGSSSLNELGEPVYGARDVVDVQVFRELGRPFWLAGSFGSADQLQFALQEGAVGIQVGTAFAFCEESGIDDLIKRQMIEMAKRGELSVFTDPVASPTGFPFKVLQMPDTISDSACYEARRRVCDLGYLRQAYRQSDGTVGWRCPGEPVNAYLRKLGSLPDTQGRKCVCNGLVATIGLGQHRRNGTELPLITCGNEVGRITQFLPSPESMGYTANDVIDCLLGVECIEPEAVMFII